VMHRLISSHRLNQPSPHTLKRALLCSKSAMNHIIQHQLPVSFYWKSPCIVWCVASSYATLAPNKELQPFPHGSEGCRWRASRGPGWQHRNHRQLPAASHPRNQPGATQEPATLREGDGECATSHSPSPQGGLTVPTQFFLAKRGIYPFVFDKLCAYIGRNCMHRSDHGYGQKAVE